MANERRLESPSDDSINHCFQVDDTENMGLTKDTWPHCLAPYQKSHIGLPVLSLYFGEAPSLID